MKKTIINPVNNWNYSSEDAITELKGAHLNIKNLISRQP